MTDFFIALLYPRVDILMLACGLETKSCFEVAQNAALLEVDMYWCRNSNVAGQ
jgi:hypothetical protein